MTIIQLLAEYFKDNNIECQFVTTKPNYIKVCHGFYWHWVELDENTIKIGVLGFTHTMHTIPLEHPTALEETISWLLNTTAH